jgi:uncharacterized protein YdaU (DUF1376 family)
MTSTPIVGKSPAFSFYAKDFLTGTATMSLAERGAYATLLAHQWDAGSVPGDDMAKLSRLLGVTPTQARKLWDVVGSKFTSAAAGYVNPRLEEERGKQQDRRQKLAENGSKGGARTQANKQHLLQQQGQQNSSLPSSSSSSDLNTNTNTPLTPLAGGHSPSSSSADAGTPKKTAITRRERKAAEDVIDEFGCPHAHPEAKKPVPPCETREECIGRIVGEHRALAERGLAAAS